VGFGPEVLMAKGKLSDRQREMMDFIKRFTQDKGYPPTIRQIGEAVRISSTSVVNYNLNKLERDGYILRDLKVSRGVRLADGAGPGNGGPRRPARTEDRVSIPVLGYIFASKQPELVGDTRQTSDDEVIELTRDMIRDEGDLFALRVKGDSMIDAMVNDGDIVVMKKVDRVRNGEMAAVWLSDRNETTLKHFYLENGRVRLQPANPTLRDIIIDDPSTVMIQGKVMLVLRQLN
jgi:repressor LexA